VIHIFPVNTEKFHCLDMSGMCGCKPVLKALCPTCEGVGVIDLTHPEAPKENEEIVPVIIHRYRGRVCYGQRQSYC